MFDHPVDLPCIHYYIGDCKLVTFWLYNFFTFISYHYSVKKSFPFFPSLLSRGEESLCSHRFSFTQCEQSVPVIILFDAQINLVFQWEPFNLFLTQEIKCVGEEQTFLCLQGSFGKSNNQIDMRHVRNRK